MASAVDIAAVFGDNLVRVRRSADVSQDELARLCGIRRSERAARVSCRA